MTDRGTGMLYFPTLDQVESLQVGDVAPDCFGGLSPVVEIFGRGNDIEGRAYVCFYNCVRGTLTVSNSIKADTICRSVSSSNIATSAQIDSIERAAREGRGICEA